MKLTVNGEPREIDGAWGGESLLYALRERLGLPGSKNACEQGECGSCSVYLDGTLVCSCLVLAAQAEGREVVTVEGLAPAGELHAIQQAFVDAGAVQCGFCTPGLIVASHDLLARDAAALGGRHPRGAGRQHLPLHRLREDHRRGPAGRRAARRDDRPARSRAPARGRRRRRLQPRARRTGSRRCAASSSTRRTWASKGMLWGATLRSPHPRARIRSLDTSAAAALPGVHAVLTHADVPGRKTYGLEHADQPVLAWSDVRFKGEPVAIVAADHPETARRAADLIAVDFEVLDPVTDAEQAMTPLAPRAARGRQRAAPRPDPARRPGRDRGRRRARELRGRDAGPGLPRPRVRPRGAGRRRRRRAAHRDAVAARRPRPGRARASGSRPRPCGSRSAGSAARSAGARTSRCRSTPACSRCARGRPGEDGLLARGVVRRPRAPPSLPDGVRARRATRTAGSSTCTRGSCSTAAPTRPARPPSARTPRASPPGPYAVPNARLTAFVAYTNNPPCGAMRGFGAVQVAFAYEAQMDKLAERARDRPGRAADPQRDGAGRHAPDRPGRARAGARRRAARARARHAAAARRRRARPTSASCRAAWRTRRTARACGAASATPSGSRTSASRRASTTTRPRACGSPPTPTARSSRCTRRRSRSARASRPCRRRSRAPSSASSASSCCAPTPRSARRARRRPRARPTSPAAR